MKMNLNFIIGILMIYLGSAAAFGETLISLAGRTYSNELKSIEFVTADLGVVNEGSGKIEFSYQYDGQLISIDGTELRPQFPRFWFVKEDSQELQSADGRIKLYLEKSLEDQGSVNATSTLFDINSCPSTFCQGTHRCWYRHSQDGCLISHCRPAKSCE
jgi:hypothetical protein